MRHITLATWLALIVASCGGDDLTVTEYAQQVEGLTTTMYERLDELTIEDSRVPTMEEIQALYHGMATAYRGLLDGLEAIEPPSEAAELHATSLGFVQRLTDTQEAYARRADDMESGDDFDMLLTSPEARAADAARVEMIAFCLATQARLDATADRQAFEDLPWIPSELQEVVQVVFGCETGPGTEGS